MLDAIETEVFNKLFSSIAEEMGIILTRASFSSNIKERRDFSCAIFDGRGRLVAQASHIPVHLGSMPATLAAVLEAFSLSPGDIAITNDPFSGGSHLPDITLVEAVFSGSSKTPAYYVVNRAHHADVGGISPGSMGLCRSIDQEGVRIAPSYLYRKGRLNKNLLDHFLGRVRNPEERLGDLRAQRASLARGRQRLLALLKKHGRKHLIRVQSDLFSYGSRLMEATIAGIADGTYRFTDYLDDDGLTGDRQVRLSVAVTIDGSRATVDFSDSADQVASPVNTVKSVTVSATIYAFLCLLGNGYPVNHGSYLPLAVVCRHGSIVDASYPAAVAAGNVETSQRIVDVLFGALAKAAPQRVPAASCGSMNNIAIGGRRADGNQFSYYETIGGGMGGRPGSAGLAGIHTHMTNTMNTPVEALEHSYPFEIVRYGLRKSSGGKGRCPGGDGIIRSYRFNGDAQVSLLSERRKLQPYGLNGGGPGKTGENILERGKKKQKLAGKASFSVRRGDILHIKTPGGGGWGEERRTAEQQNIEPMKQDGRQGSNA